MRILTIKTQVPNSVFLKLEQAPKEMRRGLKDAVNEMARQTGEDIRNKVMEDYTLKASLFRKGDVRMNRATNSKLMAKLTIEGGPISLKKGYKTRKNTKHLAVRAKVKKGPGFKELKKGKSFKAFITRVQTGHEGVYHYDIFQRESSSKLPIKIFQGPGRAKLSEKIFEQLKGKREMELKRRINMMAERIMQ